MRIVSFLLRINNVYCLQIRNIRRPSLSKCPVGNRANIASQYNFIHIQEIQHRSRCHLFWIQYHFFDGHQVLQLDFFKLTVDCIAVNIQCDLFAAVRIDGSLQQVEKRLILFFIAQLFFFAIRLCPLIMSFIYMPPYEYDSNPYYSLAFGELFLQLPYCGLTKKQRCLFALW